MSASTGLVLAILLGSIVLFVSGALRADLVACLVLAIILVSQLVTPEQALSGFANPATVTVAAMFVLSAGLQQTGCLEPLGLRVSKLIRSERSALPLLLLSGGLVSALINNTAAVAVLMAIILGACRRSGVSPSPYLMPLSFVSMMGGMLTLMGTSTNLLVDAIATDHGMRPFGLFEFAPLALILLVAGCVYLMLFGRMLLPARRQPQELTADYEMGSHLSEVSVADDRDSEVLEDLRADVLKLLRQNLPRSRRERLEPDDLVTMRVDEPERLTESGLRLGPQPVTDETLEDEESMLVEAEVGPELEGTTLAKEDVKRAYGATPLAVHSKGKTQHRDLENRKLKPGDTILFQVVRDQFQGLKLRGGFILFSPDEEEVEFGPAGYRALAIVLAMVLLATFGVLPIVTAATVAAVAMVVAGCLTAEQAYKSIDWQVIFLLAGMLSLGIAMEETGTARWLAFKVLEATHGLGNQGVLGVLYLLTLALTAFMSNNATAAVLTPVAISMARELGVDPTPLVVAVAFAASACFLSPVGYQTNVMVMGPGRFSFLDFVRVGAPLNLLFLVLSVWLIPVFWSF